MASKYARRHYNDFASAVLATAEDREAAGDGCDGLWDLVEAMERVFRSDNPRFDIHRFRVACGVGSPTTGTWCLK